MLNNPKEFIYLRVLEIVSIPEQPLMGVVGIYLQTETLFINKVL